MAEGAAEPNVIAGVDKAAVATTAPKRGAGAEEVGAPNEAAGALLCRLPRVMPAPPTALLFSTSAHALPLLSDAHNPASALAATRYNNLPTAATCWPRAVVSHWQRQHRARMQECMASRAQSVIIVTIGVRAAKPSGPRQILAVLPL
jgi:hypothetical protein